LNNGIDDFVVKKEMNVKNTPIIRSTAMDWLTGKCSIKAINTNVKIYKAE
jgi:hypothetical protein